MPVDVVHWNPAKPIFPGVIGRLIPLRKRVNNFGDLLGPEIVRRVLFQKTNGDYNDLGKGRLVAVGSILAMARHGDDVWGAGINGKSLDKNYDFSNVKFHAVRGPLTREFVSSRGGLVPEVYGDPGLLVSMLWSESELVGPKHEVTIVPNLNDMRYYDLKDKRVMDPTKPLIECLSRIRNSNLVVGSSLHAIIVAESFKVPARLVRSAVEPEFKYLDYYTGSGRTSVDAASTVDDAIKLGGKELPNWDPHKLLAAFPYYLWNL